jgi:hypothetical protein
MPAVEVKVTANGKALLPIVISDNASPRVQEAANTLGKYLTQISGAQFEYKTAPAPLALDSQGVVLGTAADFPDQAKALEADDPTRTEDYLLRSHKGGVLLIGASELGLEHAVWDMLHRLGYRQFFPGKDWEIVPKAADIRIAVDVREHPDYYVRSIWPGFGTSQPNYAEWKDWWAKNRATKGIELNTGHSYNSIILRNQKEFDAHPEYYALVKGKRQTWNGGKFCISNAGLRRLVIEDSLRQFEQNPKLQSISLDPSDGGDWCECPQCQAMGSVTDRVVTLANEVAEAVNKKYPGKFIGIYAYNEHSPPPTIPVDPHVVVSIATAFIRGGYTLDQLIDGWGQQAHLLGIREYYSFYKWDWDLPGMARGGNLEYLKTTTPRFYQRGARFMTSESSDNWGPNGLGYYVASRLLWDTGQAAHVDEIVADFLDKAFGPARAPMAEFYRLIDGSNKVPLTQDLVGRLYRSLDEALKLTDDEAIRTRLYDLALYVRYLDNAIAVGERKPSFEEGMRFAWRIYRTHMIHTAAIWTVSAAQLPPEAAANLPEDKNPWKSDKPYTPQEIETFIKDGLANNKIADFTPVAFSQELVPAAPLQLESGKLGDFGFIRGKTNFYTWAAQAPAVFSFDARCGIGTGAVNWSTVFALFSKAEATGAASATAEAPCDLKNTYPIRLATNLTGLQSIAVDDGTAGVALTWPEGTPLTFESSMRWQHHFQGKWSLYFYVPRGTKVVGGYRASKAAGQVVGPDGALKLALDAKDTIAGYWSVPVKAGEDGRLWQIQDATGEIRLLTVPPYLARSAQELLLPKEVVDADRAH